MSETSGIDDLSGLAAKMMSDLLAEHPTGQPLVRKRLYVSNAEQAGMNVTCPACQGSGQDRNPIARAWGWSCWFCGGWGSQLLNRKGLPTMRGPVTRAPGVG